MFDMTKRKKKSLAVRLPNGDDIVLFPPKKKLYERIIRFEQNGEIGKLYEMVAEVINSNPTRKYSMKDIEEMLDTEEVLALFSEYLSLIREVQDNPN